MMIPPILNILTIADHSLILYRSDKIKQRLNRKTTVDYKQIFRLMTYCLIISNDYLNLREMLFWFKKNADISAK